MKRNFSAVLMVLSICLIQGKAPVIDGPHDLVIKEADGVPVLWEAGMPYFTLMTNTDHHVLDISGTWKFMPDPEDEGEELGWNKASLDHSRWHDHPVPGSWNVQKEEWLYYEGTGWYRTSFVAPQRMEGRFNRLVFDGVAYRADVYLNGELVGYHSGGFSRWSLDVSEWLRYGDENTLVLRVNNTRAYTELPARKSPGSDLGWWYYGGINRKPVLESSPHLTTAKLAVDTDHEGLLRVDAVFYNNSGEDVSGKAEFSLHTLDGDKVADLYAADVAAGPGAMDTVRFLKTLEGMKPWSPETPGNRYLLEISLAGKEGGETQSVEIGFRKFEFRGTKAYLNGKPIFLRGINRHEDFPETGPVQTDYWIEKDMELLHEMHVNFMRPAHYPHDPRWLDACDREGILITHEIPQYQLGAPGMTALAVMGNKLYRNAARQMVETIERDRNHPSVVMWSVGNESMTFLTWVRRFHARLIKVTKKFDPERPVTFALSSERTLGPSIEITGGLADVLFFNEYYGWYGGESEGVEWFVDKVHEKWPDKPLVVSEFGAGASPLVDGEEVYSVGSVSHPFTEEYQARHHRIQMEIFLKKDYITGTMPWVFADFRDDKRGRNPVVDFNLKGLVTYDRVKKPAFDVIAEFYEEIEKEGHPAW